MNTTQRLVPFFCVASCVAFALAAGAQTTPTVSPDVASGSQPETTTSSKASETELGEITVTAQKRSENINKVGLTIQAFSGDSLAQQGVTSVADLVKVVPSLTYANSYYNTPVYTLRGVGFYDNSLAAYPAVSVYVDEVPIPFPVLTSRAGLDAERVEVLKGPQGTLFGENSTGGAINYIAAKPTRNFQEGATIGFNNFQETDATAFVSGPLTDGLRARLAVKGTSGGAWQQSYTRDDSLGDSRVFATRLLLDYDATSALRFELNLNGDVDHSDPQAGQYFAFHPQLPVIGPALAAVRFAPQNDQAADWNPLLRPKGDDEQYQAALRVSYDVTNDISLTSLTSYIDFKRHQIDDPDGTDIQELDFIFNDGLKTASQEIRLSNGNDNTLRWTVGANFEHSTSSEFAYQYDGDGTVGTTLGFPANSNNVFLDTTTKTYAVFADGDFDVTNQLTLKAGVRYNKSDRSGDTCTLDNGDGAGFVANFFTGVSSEVRGSPTPPIPVGGCVTLNETTFLPGLTTLKLDQSNVPWRVGADFKATQDLLLYVNVAKGYKAGSFIFTNASNSDQYNPVIQESLLDYEAGFKASLLDHRVQLDGAVFDYQYNDKQIRGYLKDPIFGVLDALVNVPKSKVKGVELSVSASPFEGLTTSLAATYLNSRVDEYTGVGPTGITANFTGSSIPFAPNAVINAAADYYFPLTAFTSKYQGFLGANEVYNSATFAVIGEDPDSKIASYALMDLRGGLVTLDGRFRVSLYGHNVLNRYYYTNAPVIYDTQVRYTGRPATYGITFSYKN